MKGLNLKGDTTLMDTKYVAWCNSHIGGMNERFKFSRMFKDTKKYLVSL